MTAPAGMQLLAKRDWYIPARLDKRLPRVAIEVGESAPAPETPGAR